MRTSRSQKINNHLRTPRLIHIFLVLLALMSTLGLDYIRWKSGESSYLFSALSRKKKAIVKKKVVPEKKEDAGQIAMEVLAKLDIPTEGINLFKDETGVLHLKVDLPLLQYSRIEKALEKSLQKKDFRILEKEEQQAKEKNYYLWEVEGKDKERLSFLFSCEKEVTAIAKEPPPKPARNKVALIIDDMGYSMEAINTISSLGRPVTVAIIPYSPLALETATISKENNLEVILHLPLESINNDDRNNIEGMIYSGMSDEDIIRTVKKNLSQVPYIQGVNNHMGSKVTANLKLMQTILGLLRERNLFFIDSRTTGSSVAYDVAQSLGIPSAYRHVFLDGELDEEYIKNQLLKLFKQAQKNGFALGICHPSAETLKVLKEHFHLIEDYNLEPVFASQVVK
ncbi:divergent polysaccharide deacetylase family protein [Acidobacteriota bacterium]